MILNNLFMPLSVTSLTTPAQLAAALSSWASHYSCTGQLLNVVVALDKSTPEDACGI